MPLSPFLLQKMHFSDSFKYLSFIKRGDIMHKKLLLVDLDNTLIDRSYRLTDAQIEDAIKKIQHHGFDVVLCSDSAIEYLLEWQSKLGISPSPVIGEKGAVVFFPSIGVSVIDQSLSKRFRQLRSEVLERLSIGRENIVVCGNVNEIVSREQGWQLPMETQFAFLVNAYRRSSFSMYARRIDQGGKLTIDSKLVVRAWRSIEPIANKLFADEELVLDCNDDYGVIILHGKRTSKTTTVKRLLREISYTQCFMIGDSVADLILDKRVATLAVGNASQKLKKNAKKVAERDLTSGVVELINHCMKEGVK